MVTCNFLGNSYSFSQDIFDIHDIYTFFSDEQSKILAVLEKLASTVEKPGMVDENGNDEIVDAFRASATRVVTSLCDKDIVSYTVSDFLNKNPAYAKYQELAVNTAKSYMQIVMDTAMSFMNATMAAHDSATSTITGTGTGIITNSMASLLLYDAIEAKTINNQIASAEASYKEKLSRISDRSDRKQAEAEQNYKFHKWLPAAQDLIYEFVSYNLNQYLQIMCSNGKLRAESVKLIDAARSNELLGNCELTQNKKAVLAQAFQANPFNFEVYKLVFNYGFFTKSEYQTLSLFGFQDSFEKFIDAEKASICDITSTFSIRARISYLTKLYSFRPELSDLSSYLFSELSPFAVKRLNAYQNFLLDEKTRKDWIHKNIADNLTSLAEFSTKELESKIQIALAEEEKKYSIDILLKEKLLLDADVTNTRSIIIDSYMEYCNRFRELHSQYLSLANEYNTKSAPIQDSLATCGSGLLACGFFQFKKKHDLQEEAFRLTEELEELKPLSDKVSKAKSYLEDFY